MIWTCARGERRRIHVSAAAAAGAILDANPDAHALFTTGTVTSAALPPSGCRRAPIHQFAPLDQPAAVRRCSITGGQAALWVESDLWPNALEAARGTGGARQCAAERRASPAGGALAFAAQVLSTFQTALAQTGETAGLTALGAAGVVVTGNLKAAASPCPPRPRRSPN
ncbi:MAG: glycosyltransferase N-terminal domain-containing protein [Alphaproteobacteria bacterium]